MAEQSGNHSPHGGPKDIEPNSPMEESGQQDNSEINSSTLNVEKSKRDKPSKAKSNAFSGATQPALSLSSSKGKSRAEAQEKVSDQVEASSTPKKAKVQTRTDLLFEEPYKDITIGYDVSDIEDFLPEKATTETTESQAEKETENPIQRTVDMGKILQEKLAALKAQREAALLAEKEATLKAE